MDAKPSPSAGQALLTGIVFMLVATVMVQALAMWTLNETKMTHKSAFADMAYNAANAGLQRAYWKVTESPSTWNALEFSGPITGFNFDSSYTFDGGGTYAVQIASTSDPNIITITSVGRDSQAKELRSIKVTYVKNSLGNVAVEASNGVAITGNNFEVEWGAVVSPNTLTVNGRAHPQFWSAVGIDLDTNGSTPANCDASCVQWHSYNSNVGPMPAVDLSFYKSSAQATGTYYSGSQTWKSQSLTSGGVYYVDGDLTVQAPGDYIKGSLIVMGNLNLPNGKWGSGSVTMSMPTDAWKQYGNDWDHYRSTFDSAAPVSFPGLASTYVSASTLTFTSNQVFVNGFMYVSGNISSSGGGGSADIYGAVMVNGSASLGANSGATLYYNETAAGGVRTTSISLGQSAWTEIVRGWPSGL